MKVKILFSFYEEIVPPRCRKPRPVLFTDGETEIEIREVSANEAPVAMIGRGEVGYGDKAKPFEVVYRWWEQCLWCAINTDHGKPRGRYSGRDNYDWPTWPSVVDLRDTYQNSSYDFWLKVPDFYRSTTRDKVEACLQSQANSHLLIDGVPYRPVGEPRYVVMTFGLGQNHGGTAVMQDSYYNSNIANSSYFNLFDRDKAIALATEIATERGDDKSLPITPHGPEWEILIPEAIQLCPAEQHGDGDPFLNSLNAITQATGGAPVGGLMAMALAVSTK